jgi:hypothetical protein
MNDGETKSLGAIGFLTVLEHEQHGLIGGYLVLNTVGRPLEFHCTAPVKPSRAQQILFGPTLESYLYGEQIGQTLLAKSSIEPLVVCTDVGRALSVRDYVSLPVALVVADGQTATAAELPTTFSAWRVDTSHRTAPNLQAFDVGPNRLAVPNHREADRHTISTRLEVASSLDLSEPFERIREAVEEANKSGRG